MLMVFALLPAASAETALRVCDPLSVYATVPASGQTNVPTDARLVALLSGCYVAGDFLVELVGEDGAPLIAETQSVSATTGTGLIALYPEGGLTPNSDFVLRITPEVEGEVTEVGFRTGEGLVQGLGGELPLFTLEAPFSYKESGRLVVTWGASATAVSDPDGLSLVGVLSEAGDGFTSVEVPSADGAAWLSGAFYPEKRPKELCLQAVQIDGRGDQTAPVEACAKVERRGCSAVPAAPGLFAAALALLGLWRRAPQRGHCVK